ncbi:siroheme synthase [Geobacillus subterraneus]|uniref:precorrin-2 dehydrogenase n=2 Tax=Geobacillus TaxID=129337 RepID=A0ABM6AE37_9BACL|nr:MULTISPECIES: bifunctional precorrin-2 dehydrogenase/sirohydrochlorin ferrochelatase [Geobacillus]AMX84601.1 siroheme synthase [Geobacillus subterraneus]KZS24802.1 siroheme synthase [Geobacillus subterraneus]OXB85421.1 siroheme synthase [Geobacillus uzenensis]
MGYSVILQVRGRRAVVVGGGKVAARKIRGLLEAGADVVMIAPKAEPELQALAAAGTIGWCIKTFAPGDLDGAFLVIAATNDRGVNEAVAQAAAPGQLVNVVDDPERCDFHVPAVVRRGPLTIAVSTEGASPAVARRIRRELEEQYGEEYGPYLEFLQRARDIVLREVDDVEGRKRLFRALAADSFRQNGRWDEELAGLLAKEKERGEERRGENDEDSNIHC